MTSGMRPVCGILCSVCTELLYPPIVMMDDCRHNAHQACFFRIREHGGQCGVCNGAVSGGWPNRQLDKITCTIDRLAWDILNTRQFSATPLGEVFHAAIKADEFDVVSTFIDEEFPLSTLVGGISPLYTACSRKNIPIAMMLLNKGADPRQMNDLSDRCRGDPYWGVIDIAFHHHGATPMMAAARVGSKSLVNLLSLHKAPFDDIGPYGQTPTFAAVQFHHEELALYLLDRGARVNVTDDGGTSLLSMAVANGFTKVVQKLVEGGVDVRQADRSNSTSLFVAAGRSNPEIVKFLLENGASHDINLLWKGIWSPLAAAARSGNVENVKLLVKCGADLTWKYQDLSILSIAQAALCDNEGFYRMFPPTADSKRVLENRRAVVTYFEEHFML